MSLSSVSGRRWVPLGLILAALSWPATAAFASTSPPTLPVSLSPCAAPTATTPCQADPAQIQVDLPTDNSVQAVEVSWVGDPRRPSSAPVPAKQQVVLTTAAGPEAPVTCQHPTSPPSGFAAFCWNWPTALDYTYGGAEWLLNGTYRVAPCSASSASTPCSYSSEFNSALTEVAVAPSAPTGVAAQQSNGSVTVSWRPGPEPDLVGYTVSRNDQTVYTCTTDGAGPGAATACANPPVFHDQPGSGTWHYSVSSLRFGADASAAHVVTSPAAPTSLYVPVAPPSPSGDGATTGQAYYGSRPAGHAIVPPLPAAGTMRPAGFDGFGGVAGGAVPSLANAEEAGGGMSGSPGSMAYADHSALGDPLASGTLLRQQRAAHNVDIAAELAIAVLALALAVHAWYLRGELRAASIRVAARRAASGTAT